MLKRTINSLFSFSKYVLLIIAFGLTLFISLKFSERTGEFTRQTLMNFVPYVILVLLFILNMSLNKKSLTDNIHFNLVACMVFIANIFIDLRAIMDENLLFNSIQGKHVNFVYYNDNSLFILIMLVSLIITNILFLFIPNSFYKEESNNEVGTKEVVNNKPQNESVSIVEMEDVI